MICDEDPLRRRPRESTARRKRQERVCLDGEKNDRVAFQARGRLPKSCHRMAAMAGLVFCPPAEHRGADVGAGHSVLDVAVCRSWRRCRPRICPLICARVTVRPTWGAQEHRRWDRLVAEHHYLPFQRRHRQRPAPCRGARRDLARTDRLAARRVQAGRTRSLDRLAGGAAVPAPASDRQQLALCHL